MPVYDNFPRSEVRNTMRALSAAMKPIRDESISRGLVAGWEKSGIKCSEQKLALHVQC